MSADSEDNEPLLTLGGFDPEGRLLVRSRGVTSLRVSAYTVDAELLFTSDPFGQAALGGGGGGGGGGLGRVAFVRPTASATVPVAAAAGGDGGGEGGLALSALRLSEVLRGVDDSSSILVEVSGGGLTRTAHRWAARCKHEQPAGVLLLTATMPLMTGKAADGQNAAWG
jgi:hypothetical protein